MATPGNVLMPRAPRLAMPGVPIHVIQRGNNREPCFRSAEVHRRYLQFLGDAARRYGCAVHAYVLMTNHVHLLLTPTSAGATSRMMQQLGRRYVRKYNGIHARSGTLWEGRFRGGLIDSESYFIACMRYIELNPVRAGIVRAPGDYPWSSYRHHAERRLDPLLVDHTIFLRIAEREADRADAYRTFCAANVADEELRRIRTAAKRGLPISECRTEPELHVSARLLARLPAQTH